MSTVSEELERQLEKHRLLESNIWYRFTLINRILEQQVLDIVAVHGLNVTGYRIMRCISIFERISISDISRLMLVDRAQISRSAIELAKQGLLEFDSDPSSKRKKIAMLSAKGRELMAELDPIFAERRELLNRTVGEDALPALWTAIENLSRLKR